MTSEEKLIICKKTRTTAADSLFLVLSSLLHKNNLLSEFDVAEAWHKELSKHSFLFPDGWYIPPPHGIGVLFATDENPQRTQFKSLRHLEYWPRKDIFLDTQGGFGTFYCSPVERTSGIIGDFGVSIYFGKNKTIKKQLHDHLHLIHEIFGTIQRGQSFAQIHNRAKQLLARYTFTNDWWISITDPTGTNFGHTLPGIEQNWSKEEKNLLHNITTPGETIATMINKNRKFINSFETKTITAPMAITIEPRVIMEKHRELPTTYFHTTALFYENGKKELLTNFEKIFRIANMDYLI